jgi:streptogramin lyase
VEYKSDQDGMTYGVTGDAKGDGWWFQINNDLIYHSDSATGKVEKIKTPFGRQGAPFLKPSDMSDKEYLDIVFGIGSVRGGAQMPRRGKSDATGDSIWVGNWGGNNLMRIDTKTKKMELYEAPYVGMLPYDVHVDPKGRVWVALQNSDDIARFDPDTKKWTIYPLPTKGVSARSIVAVERPNGSIEVAVPANDASRVIKLIPGTAAEYEALKKRYGTTTASIRRAAPRPG